MRKLAGRRAVVTGGSSGIGLATAKALAARGMHVALVARDRVKLEAARKDVEAARGDQATEVAVFSADVSTYEGASAAMERVAGTFGVPDVLVNTAGIILPGYFESMPVDDFETCMRNGYYTCVYPTRAAVPYMIERGAGHIVNVSSAAGYLGVFGYTAYCPSKYAVMGFCEALRSEMKPLGIDVSVVCPPDTDTPGLAFEKTLRPHETDVVCGNIKVMAPERVAAEIVRGVEKRRYLIIPGMTGKLYHLAKGILPGLVFAVVDSDVAKARKQRLERGAEPAAEQEQDRRAVAGNGPE